jgi:3-hydroxyacyl-[acyl-carrier-protein] dehydratase
MKIEKETGTFYFDPSDKIYNVHFPKNPVVPGTVIIHAFITILQKKYMNKITGVRDFRFRHFISPGEYCYSVEHGKDYLKCTLSYNNTIAATGIFTL